LAWLIAGLNCTQINLAYVLAAGAELFPRSERDPLIADAYRLGKIITATGRDNQNRKL